MSHSPGFLALVNAARRSIKETDVSSVHARMAAGETFRLIDIREESEWAAGHLPNAEYLGRGILERDVESRIPNRQDSVVLYCGGGFRSALAAESLLKMGYDNVSSMDGGFKGWKAAGYPVVHEG